MQVFSNSMDISLYGEDSHTVFLFVVVVCGVQEAFGPEMVNNVRLNKQIKGISTIDGIKCDHSYNDIIFQFLNSHFEASRFGFSPTAPCFQNLDVIRGLGLTKGGLLTLDSRSSLIIC